MIAPTPSVEAIEVTIGIVLYPLPFEDNSISSIDPEVVVDEVAYFKTVVSSLVYTSFSGCFGMLKVNVVLPIPVIL